MQTDDNHIADRELLLEADGEVSAARAARIRNHLAGCWSCRTRKEELESAIGDFVKIHYRKFDGAAMSADGPRALLRARLAEEAAAAPRREWFWRHRLAWAGSLVLLAALSGVVAWLPSRHAAAAFAPDARWTPGAIRSLDRNAVCSIPEPATLRPVAAPVAQQVFSRYGISRAAAAIL